MEEKSARPFAETPFDAPGGAPGAPRDWFLAAIESDGTVGDSLDSVLAELTRRAAFVGQVKLCLELGAAKGADSLTELGLRLRALENTLRFRLGILRPERPAAWFRAPAATSTGPFQSTLLEEPVFAPYEPAEVEVVKAGLDSAWREGRATGLPFQDGADESPCLWRTLLQCKARLQQIVKLGPPFAGLGLDTLPDGLPKDLESRPLRAFLLNVRSEVHGSRDRLQSCYKQLLETSQKLWEVQATGLRRKPLFTAEPLGERPRQQAAGNLREEMKRRRDQTVRVFLTPTDLDALKFMGFAELPSPDALRQRYLAMAKRLHPDRQGGSDQAFKILSGAYAHLEKRL